MVESVGGADAMEEVLDRAPRYRRQYKIQEVIKRRQVMLVQVVKEERGTKGAALTTYLSLAGRYCVLMPNTARGGGISRKITSTDDRKKLREIAEELEVPEGMGVILRTAGAARTKAEVKRDFEYLLRQWETVRDLTLKSTAPTLVYEEGSLAKRSIRDLYSKDIDEIIVAGEQGYREAKEFMRMLMPSHAKNVKLYHDTQPIFTRYGIESQLDAMFSPTVQLRSGGYIVINQTEALVSIDVNSGRSTREHHIEDTALKTNCEAAEEVARQLRLRDLAGLIVIDFIDMDEKRNNRTVERRMKDALRNDRARIQVGRISHFGLLEMSRQRIRTSVLESSTEKCPHCGGTGHVRSVSSVALQLLRAIEETLLKGPTHNLIVRTRPEIALYVLNHKRAHLRGLEERFHVALTVNADEEVGGQTGFTIDRGEQVMSVEQAKARARAAGRYCASRADRRGRAGRRGGVRGRGGNRDFVGRARLRRRHRDRRGQARSAGWRKLPAVAWRRRPRERRTTRRRPRTQAPPQARPRWTRGEGREAGQHRQPRVTSKARSSRATRTPQTRRVRSRSQRRRRSRTTRSRNTASRKAANRCLKAHAGCHRSASAKAITKAASGTRMAMAARAAGADGAADAATGATAKAPEGGREIASAPGMKDTRASSPSPGPRPRHAVRSPLAPGHGRAPAVVAAARNGAPEAGHAPSPTPRPEPVAEAAPAPQSEPEPAAPPRRRSTVREPAPVVQRKRARGDADARAAAGSSAARGRGGTCARRRRGQTAPHRLVGEEAPGRRQRLS